MAKIPTYFNDFLSDIRLTEKQVDDLITGHTTLRDRLNEDEDLSPIIVSTFLQGSYRRATAVRPKNGKRSDVDVVVVTRLDKDEYTPEEALNLFVPFLEKHYKDKYRIQGRSLGIELSYVDLDLVITAAPSESQIGILEAESVKTDFSIEDLNTWTLTKSWSFSSQNQSNPFVFLEAASEEPEWKTEPLLIPDREAEEWKPTDPLAQIKWTWNKNKKCNKHYVNVVKALKWWRRVDDPDGAHPKSYPMEHFIGECCPDNISSVAEGVTLTLEKIVSDYEIKPNLPDHGVTEHDVFGRLTDEEYEAFYERVVEAAKIAREAFDAEGVTESANLWRELFGNKFPKPKVESNSIEKNSGFTPRSEVTTIGGNRFA